MQSYLFRKGKGDLLPHPTGVPNICSCYDYLSTETPRIVDGRFLLESVWEVCCRHGGPINERDIAWTCPLIFYSHFIRMMRNHILPARRPSGRHWGCRFDDFSCCDIWRTETEVESFSCGTCRVDFQFELEYSRWAMRSWRDCGTETESFHTGQMKEDCMWKNRRWGPGAYITGRPTDPSKPGPIEAMYKGH